MYNMRLSTIIRLTGGVLLKSLWFSGGVLYIME
jgi:hypothetical protein